LPISFAPARAQTCQIGYDVPQTRDGIGNKVDNLVTMPKVYFDWMSLSAIQNNFLSHCAAT